MAMTLKFILLSAFYVSTIHGGLYLAPYSGRRDITENEDPNNITEKPPVSECSTKYSCFGCSHLRVCRKDKDSFIETFRLTCSGKKPYCDPEKRSCSSSPTRDCTDTGLQICIDDGVFPDLTDCTRYHECKGGQAYRFKCSSGNVFNGRNCIHYFPNFIPFDCHAETGIKAPYYHESMFFAYCHNGVPLFVDKCKDGEIFLKEDQTCISMETSTYESSTD